MSRNRSTKQAAGRVDPGYVKGKRKLRKLTYGLVAALSVVAFGWWGIRAVRGDKTLESPGHLAGVHTLWENDCAKCHLPNPNGKGFLHFVKDDACLKCHDGPIHDANQKTLIPASRAETVHGCPEMDKGKPAAKAETCIQCHTEHRGTEALLAKGDTRCVQCHDNLVPDYACKPPKVKQDVKNFWTTTGKGSHPWFGRDLILPVVEKAPNDVAAYVRKYDKESKDNKAPRLVDPTPLRFNHVDPPQHKEVITTKGCGGCHQLASPTEAVGQRLDRRYMLPVKYEANCAGSCHPLKFQGTEIPIPHESLDKVRPIARGIVEDMAAYYVKYLNSLPEEEKKKNLEKTNPKTHKVTRTKPEDWAKGQVDAHLTGESGLVASVFGAGVPNWLPGVAPDVADALKKAGDESDAAAKVAADASAAADAAKQKPDAKAKAAAAKAAQDEADRKAKVAADAPLRALKDERVLGYILAYTAEQKCSKCHVMSDKPGARDLLVKLAGAPMAPSVVAMLKAEAKPATPPAAGSTQPATGPSAPLDTLPTGITNAPRRWFVSSVFNHDAHRMKETDCLRCHGDIMTSVIGKQAAIDLPIENDPDATDLSTIMLNRLNGKDTGKVAMPTLESCIQCHYQPSDAHPGAGASCQSCHVFHDRRKETPVTGTGTPVAAAAEPGSAPPAPPQ